MAAKSTRILWILSSLRLSVLLRLSSSFAILSSSCILARPKREKRREVSSPNCVFKLPCRRWGGFRRLENDPKTRKFLAGWRLFCPGTVNYSRCPQYLGSAFTGTDSGFEKPAESRTLNQTNNEICSSHQKLSRRRADETGSCTVWNSCSSFTRLIFLRESVSCSAIARRLGDIGRQCCLFLSVSFILSFRSLLFFFLVLPTVSFFLDFFSWCFFSWLFSLSPGMFTCTGFRVSKHLIHAIGDGSSVMLWLLLLCSAA